MFESRIEVYTDNAGGVHIFAAPTRDDNPVIYWYDTDYEAAAEDFTALFLQTIDLDDFASPVGEMLEGTGYSSVAQAYRDFTERPEWADLTAANFEDFGGIIRLNQDISVDNGNIAVREILEHLGCSIE